jgi:hypothetical protein
MKEIFVGKVPHAFEKWRTEIDKQLILLQNYATQDIDCQRFSTNQPLDKNYILSPTLYGTLKRCN